MKKNFLLLALIFCAATAISYAQKDKPELKVKFGKISDEELKMTKYEKDPNASAVILFDKGYLSLGSFSGMERHIRLKIFSKEAYDKANFRVLYDRDGQSVDGLKAVCYNEENGKLVETKATSKDIFEERLFEDIYVKKVTVPGVREGSIIEIKYTINNAGPNDWYFQDDIPTLWSEYEMSIPDFYYFSKLGQGFTPYIYNEETRKSETLLGTNYTYNVINYHWIQKDVPALKKEKFMLTTEDYRTKLSFFLEEIRPPNGLVKRVLPSWGEYAKAKMEANDFGDFINKKSAFKEELATVVNDKMTPAEKVQAIYNYVGSTFDVMPDYHSRSLSESIKDLKSKKKVTSTDKNLIFMNMLTASGIAVSPVLLRTRDEGHVGTSKAVYQRFNRFICHVKMEKDTFFVDASGYPKPLRVLPPEDLSGFAVEFLGEDKYQFVQPASKITDKSFNLINATLNTEGVLSGDASFTVRGIDACDMKKTVKTDGEDIFLKKEFNEIVADGKIASHTIENGADMSSELLKGKINFSTASFSNAANDKIYVNPMLWIGEKENFLKAEERLFDLEYEHTIDNQLSLTLKIPDGYKVEEMPKGLRLKTPDGSIVFEYALGVKDNVISLNTKFAVKKTSIPATEYLTVKELYGTMIAKMGEQIVLSKLEK